MLILRAIQIERMKLDGFILYLQESIVLLAEVSVIYIVRGLIPHGYGLIETISAAEAQSRATPASALYPQSTTPVVTRRHRYNPSIGLACVRCV